MKYAISYVSTAAANFPEKDVEDLLQYSSRNNDYEKITGILLYSNGNFFQVIEGERSKVNALFEKIQQDKRHYDLIPIFKKEIKGQRFDSYKNVFLSLDRAYNREDLDFYTSHVKKLDPSIQGPVKYILDSFS